MRKRIESHPVSGTFAQNCADVEGVFVVATRRATGRTNGMLLSLTKPLSLRIVSE